MMFMYSSDFSAFTGVHCMERAGCPYKEILKFYLVLSVFHIYCNKLFAKTAIISSLGTYNNLTSKLQTCLALNNFSNISPF